MAVNLYNDRWRDIFMNKKTWLIGMLFIYIPFAVNAMENDSSAGHAPVAGISNNQETSSDKFKKALFNLYDRVYEGAIFLDERLEKVMKSSATFFYESPRWMTISAGVFSGYVGFKLLNKSFIGGSAILGYIGYKAYNAYKSIVEDDLDA
jgi:hypothetical protein